jgi:hypothetical protein
MEIKLQSGSKISVKTEHNDDYYHTHTLGAYLYIDDTMANLSTEEVKLLIAALVDTLN